jgi:hypothetical protein
LKTVFDPANLFLTEADWNDPATRDNFLQHLLENLEYINNYQITNIYWTDELEKLLWDSPQLPPWRQDRDWSLRIIPAMYRSFNQAKEYIENSKSLSACLTKPILDCSQLGELTLLAFLELMHVVIDRNEEIYFCLGVNRIREDYIFSCDCHSFKSNPLIISKSAEWLDFVDLVSNYWPENTGEIDKLNTALEVMFKKIGGSPICDYEFSSAFLKDIIKAQSHRKQIIENIAKRLTLNKQQASKDSYLHDEDISGGKECRFRVTQRPSSTRIHYKYVNRRIRFLRYYGEGEHDDGL